MCATFVTSETSSKFDKGFTLVAKINSFHIPSN
jgi:hypothetical protein